MEKILRIIKKVIPKSLFKALQPLYHLLLSYVGAIVYRFPSKELYVIGITGTKGKSSTTEILNAILEDVGYKTALASTIRFKTGNVSEKNLHKMTMPGRFFMQRFMQSAVKEGCTHLVLEMTSEGTKQFRHKNISLNALVVTNLSPEHIESHGSFENYKKAKLKLRDALSNSKKKNKIIVTNADDKYGKEFSNVNVENKIEFGLNDISIVSEYPSISFSYNDTQFTSPLQGEFNIYNILSAIKLTEHMGASIESIKNTLSSFSDIPGRVQYIDEGQNFKVVVDYAHTEDSLSKLYKTFKDVHTICVLGSTGGGRDTWKRPNMGGVAEEYCNKVILTNEDPYDEDPERIVNEIADGMKEKPEIIMDRRLAIKKAFESAKKDEVVLITGKGTDPYIMIKNGGKIPWSDAEVSREELKKLNT